jgi:hypothetical protein
MIRSTAVAGIERERPKKAARRLDHSHFFFPVREVFAMSFLVQEGRIR